MPSDWITSYMDATSHLRSPESFRLWTAIATIAATLERRVWTETDVDPLYPNLYTILAGSPASGKTIMVGTARKLLADLVKPGGLHLGPDNPTKASFMAALENCAKASINGMGVNMYSAMTVLCRELGVIISKYDKDFVADLTDLYDNPPSYIAPRAVSKSVSIEAPTLNILACATPDALGDIIPENAWGQGFTSRIIFIYGTKPETYRDMFAKRREAELTKLRKELKIFFEELHGEFLWEVEAQDAIRHWFNVEKMAPEPTYSKLINYKGRRNEHVMKLAMISAVSAGHGLTVTLEDYNRAKGWLLSAEETMPDVFRAIAQKSDAQLLQDCHYYFQTKWGIVARDKRQPIKERDIWDWFQTRVPADRIPAMLVTLEKTGLFRRGVFGGDWVPNPLEDGKLPE